jgi:hypothetical protein
LKFDFSVPGSWSGRSESGMAVVEIGLPSGYAANYEKQFTDLIKRYEVQDDKLVLYFDEVN